MAVTLSLDVPALDRLFGGDAELQVSLRKQIAEQFFQRYLSELFRREAHRQFFTEYEKTAQDEVRLLLFQLLGTSQAPQPPRAELRKKLAEAAEADLKSLLAEGLARIQADVDHMATRAVNRALDALVKARTAEAVDAAVAARLGDRFDALVTAEVQRRMQVGTAAALAARKEPNG